MTNSQASPRTGIWTVPQCPFVIEYEMDVLEAISLQVIEGHHALAHGGLEVGGLLIGTFTGDRMMIRGHEPFVCEHAEGPSFTLSERDRAALAERLRNFHHRAEEGQRILGWYHSHTRSGLALSTGDLSVHYKFFNEDWQVALLLTPNDRHSSNAGFFFREPGASAIRTSSSYQEFVVESPSLVRHQPGPPLETALRPPEPATLPDRTAGGFVAVTGQEDGVIYSTPPLHTQSPRARWTIWATLTVMFVSALGAVLYLRTHYAAELAPPRTVGFVRIEAANKDGNLEIRWDPKLVSGVKQARLEVQDGALRAELILDDNTLEAGSLTYAARSDVTGFHLVVDRKDGMILEGSTTYIAPDAPPAVVAQVKETMDEAAREQRDVVEVVAVVKPELKATVQFQPPPQQPAALPKPVELAVAPPTIQPEIPSSPAAVTSAAQVADRMKPPEPASEPPPTPAPKPAVVAESKPKPATPAPKPALQLAGTWTLQPGAASRSPGVPESVAINVVERDGAIQGSLDARYRVANSKSEKLNFSFAGRMENGVARFPWTAKDGQRGQIEFIRVSPDTVEVVFYGPDSKRVYDHIVRRTN